MHYLAWSFVAVVCYALNAALVERFMRGNHALWNLLIANGLTWVYCAGAMAMQRASGNSVTLHTDTRTAIALGVLCPLILFIGHAAFYQGVATKGSSIIAMLNVLSLMPIVAALFITCISRKLPTANEWIGSVIVLIGILVFLRR